MPHLLSSFRDRFIPRRNRPARPARRRVAVEALEDRRLLAASLDVSSGVLTFQAAGSAMNLSISVDAADVYTFTDPTQAITLGAGAGAFTLSGDNHTVTGPASAFTSISVVGDAGAFNDVVRLTSTKAPVAISTGAGNDSFFFATPTIAAAVTLANTATGAADADNIFYTVGASDGTFSTGALGRETFQSAAAGAGLISVTSSKPIFASQFPDLAGSGATLDLNLNSLYAAPTALSSTLSLASAVVTFNVAGGPVYSFPEGTIDAFDVGGTAAGSTLTIDYGGGIPYGPGVNFSPPVATGGASNTLVLQNGQFTQEAYIASGAGAGRIAFPNRTVGSSSVTNVIDFTNLSPIVDTVTVGGFTFSAPVGAQSIEVLAGPVVSGAQTTRIRSTTNAFERIDFANKGSVIINTGAEADTVSVDLSAPAAGLTGVAINTAAGDDTVVLLASAATVATTIDVGAGAANLIDLSNSGSLAGLLGGVFALATGGATTLKLDDSARSVADSFAIAPGRITGGPIGSFVDYAGGGVTDVEVRGGTVNDTFTFNGFGGATTAERYTIAGGPGTDTLVVNSTLPTVNFATAGLISFGAGQPVIEYTSIEQVTLNVSTTPPTPIPVTLIAGEARPAVQQTVARFTDAAPTAGVVYYASIDWGDGTPVSGGLIVPAGVTGTYEVLGNHTYAAAASSYPLTVTVTRQGGGSSGTTVVGGVPITVNSGAAESVVINSTAVVYAAPLAAQGIPLSGRAGSPLSTGSGGIQVASFVDTGTNLPTTGYTALIYWGDGSEPTAATQITATGTAGGIVYNVFGDHTYAQPGNYPVTVLITKPPVAVPSPAVPQAAPGAQAVAATTVNVLPRALTTAVGRLNPASDSGVSNSDGITNVVQPTYSGMADSPGATIAVVATAANGNAILLGSTTTDGAGAWSVTSGVALTDGSYSITVYAGDLYNSSNVITNVLAQALVIDTFGPKVVGTTFQPLTGSVLISYQDYGGGAGLGSGVNLATIQDPTNYNFSFISTTVRRYRPPTQWLVGPIAVAPGTTTGPQAATVQINGGTPIRGGVYQIVVRSRTAAAPTAVQDIAGNALDGEFYGTFPSGNNVAGGDFTARLDSIHNRVFAPGTTVGPGRPRPGRPTPPVRPVRPGR